MMNFEEYVESVLNEIRAKADKKYHIRREEVVKNNGRKLTGIVLMTERSGPCVYLDGFYREYERGKMEFDETVDEIYTMLMENLDALSGIDVSAFLEWETVRDSIHAKLVNAEQNKEMLDTVPHRIFLDLAVVYYAMVGGFEDQRIGMVLINNEYMKKWGKEEDNLYQKAMENMRAEGKPFFRDMETVICGLLLQEDVDVPFYDVPQPGTKMFVLSNCRRHFGAAEILDKSTLQMIADKIGDGFIVLPSSVHEAIILPHQNKTKYGKLADMIREVNNTQVDVEECLSYHVYAYSRDEDGLQIVA